MFTLENLEDGLLGPARSRVLGWSRRSFSTARHPGGMGELRPDFTYQLSCPLWLSFVWADPGEDPIWLIGVSEAKGGWILPLSVPSHIFDQLCPLHQGCIRFTPWMSVPKDVWGSHWTSSVNCTQVAKHCLCVEPQGWLLCTHPCQRHRNPPKVDYCFFSQCCPLRSYSQWPCGMPPSPSPQILRLIVVYFC